MADGRPAFYAGQLRKVPSPREGGLQKQQGESPGKGTETAQPRDNAMIPMGMRSSEDLVKRRLPTGASSNGRIDFSSSAGRAHSRMPSASQEVNRKGLMSFTWLLYFIKGIGQNPTSVPREKAIGADGRHEMR